MRKKLLLAGLVATMMLFAGCGEKEAGKSYMGGHTFGDSQKTVEADGNAETIMGMKVKDWVYMYDPTKLKTVVYEMDPSISIDEVVKLMNESFGEAKVGVRGENAYTEYTWVDGEEAVLYAMVKIAPEDGEENNVIIQVNRGTKYR